MVKNSDNQLTTESDGFSDKPEWLTADIFREFLENDFPDFKKINKCLITAAVPPGENYMTIMLRVKLDVALLDDSIANTSYMVKIMPKMEQMQSMVEEWQVFAKEHTTYTKYIPTFEEYYRQAGVDVKFAPRILKPSKVAINDDVVILEDLRPKGFKNFSRHLGLDMEHTKAVLKKLAQFHAASARYAQVAEEYPSLYDQCLGSDKDLFADYRANICKMFREHLPMYGDVQHLDEKLKTYAETHADSFQLKSDRCADEFNVLNHGDLWINNMMFQYTEDGELNETYFIDLQMGRYGSPAQDLLYFLLSSVNLEIKLQHFDYFISYYHENLIKNLEIIKYDGKMPQLRDIHAALFKHDYWGYTVITALLPVVLCEPREDANVENLLNDDGEDFRRATFSNPKFAENMRIILPWLDNRGAFDL